VSRNIGQRGRASSHVSAGARLPPRDRALARRACRR